MGGTDLVDPTLIPVLPGRLCTGSATAISSLFPKEAEGGRRDLVPADALVNLTSELGGTKTGLPSDPRRFAVKLAPSDRDVADCSLGCRGHPCDIQCPEPQPECR